jgi:NAD(P)-dependent dehydrogenase (short-subunit alcohol dehydrogenase family)
MLEIKDSVAVITGGGGGIGFALAQFWVKMAARWFWATSCKNHWIRRQLNSKP